MHSSGFQLSVKFIRRLLYAGLVMVLILAYNNWTATTIAMVGAIVSLLFALKNLEDDSAEPPI